MFTCYLISIYMYGKKNNNYGPLHRPPFSYCSGLQHLSKVFVVVYLCLKMWVSLHIFHRTGPLCRIWSISFNFCPYVSSCPIPNFFVGPSLVERPFFLLFTLYAPFGIGASISIGQEIWCLPYAGFLPNRPTGPIRSSICNVCLCKYMSPSYAIA